MVILGDINLDFNQISNPNYLQRKIYDIWLSFVDEIGLTQKITKPTWRRVVKGNLKESIIDHVYTNFDEDVDVLDLNIGDHNAVFLREKQKGKSVKKPNISFKRSWKNYSKNKLLEVLSSVDWRRFEFMDIDQMADFLDIELMDALNKLAPETLIRPHEQSISWSDKLVRIKKKKRNLLNRARKTKNKSLFKKAKAIDKEFRRCLIEEKRRKIRLNISLNNQETLWSAITF